MHVTEAVKAAELSHHHGSWVAKLAQVVSEKIRNHDVLGAILFRVE
jgi:hypothetical protein